MRIISDFKDYYDAALSFGAEPNITYVRKQEQYEWPAFAEGLHMPRQLDQVLRLPVQFLRRLPHTLTYGRSHEQATKIEIPPITAKLIGFCGMLYPAIEIHAKTFYDISQIPSQVPNDFLETFGLNQRILADLLALRLRNEEWYFTYGRKPLTFDFWNKTIREYVGKRFDDVFIELGLPLFKLEYIALNTRGASETIRCTLNPYLRPDKFQRIKPPAEAFQEISMYMGNQLARQIDPVTIVPDDVLRDEKGFDKWSFRRHKEEDKKLQKKNRSD